MILSLKEPWGLFGEQGNLNCRKMNFENEKEKTAETKWTESIN